MGSFMPSEFSETIKILKQTIEQLEAENAALRMKLEEGFTDAVKAFSDSLHNTLDGDFNSSQYSETHPMGLGPN
jgi:hypothetical protein